MENIGPTFDWEDDNPEAQCYGVYDKEDYYLDRFSVETPENEELKIDDEMTGEELPFIRTFQATKVVLCMSSVANKLHKGELSGGNQWTERDGTKITVKMQSSTMPIPLTAFDMAVHSAIVSLYDSGIQEFSIAAVCRTLCLNPKMSKISAKLQTAVRSSIEKMSGIETTILKEPSKGQGEEYRGRLLEIEVFEGRTDNGRTLSFWKCSRPPIIYQYSLDHKQCWACPIKTIQTGGMLTNSRDVISLRYCLLRRIAIMHRQAKTPKRYSNQIKYDSIYRELLMNARCQWTTRKLRNVVEACLKCWKESNFIGDYRVYKRHTKAIGVEINLVPPVW